MKKLRCTVTLCIGTDTPVAASAWQWVEARADPLTDRSYCSCLETQQCIRTYVAVRAEYAREVLSAAVALRRVAVVTGHVTAPAVDHARATDVANTRRRS